MNFAIVDCEATSGAKATNRIIEIGIVLMDGTEVVDTYQSLIDPGIPVPPFVENLTGIKTSMLAHQPQFKDVAETVFEKLGGRVFVAHNVTFDYNLVKTELARTANKLELPRLCTLKMSRKVFPGLKFYNLGAVSEYLGVPDFSHHRALDDAKACAEILRHALEKVGEDGIRKFITGKLLLPGIHKF